MIVENQLGDSDHRHLGQLMTYAGGTDPAHVVWLAHRFRDEHRAALEWLNDLTDELTRFFAVQLEAVRIGDSAPAPLLTLVVQPNDWGKRVRASADAQVRRWTRADLIRELAGVSPPLAEVTAVVTKGGRTIQPWTVSSDWATGGRPSWDLNLDKIHKSGRGLPDERLVELVERLSGLPHVRERCAVRGMAATPFAAR